MTSRARATRRCGVAVGLLLLAFGSVAPSAWLCFSKREPVLHGLFAPTELDPWGNEWGSFQEGSPDLRQWPKSEFYSFGPNGLDEGGGGDDFVPPLADVDDLELGGVHDIPLATYRVSSQALMGAGLLVAAVSVLVSKPSNKRHWDALVLVGAFAAAAVYTALVARYVLPQRFGALSRLRPLERKLVLPLWLTISLAAGVAVTFAAGVVQGWVRRGCLSGLTRAPGAEAHAEDGGDGP